MHLFKNIIFDVKFFKIYIYIVLLSQIVIFMVDTLPRTRRKKGQLNAEVKSPTTRE
jgi:hypothetical protein